MAHALNTDRYPDDPNGIYVASDKPVRRLGLALEPTSSLLAWVGDEQLDALWLHRPWKLDVDALPKGVGVLAHHLSFDEHLTLGLNPRLATALGLSDIHPFGEKDGRPIGMIGNVTAQPFEAYRARLGEVFGGLEATSPPLASPPFDDDVTRVAVVGAMNDVLVRDAAQQGATLYLTGTFRERAAEAVRDTGFGVVVVGHERSERWGMGALAGLLRERFAGLEVLIAD